MCGWLAGQLARQQMDVLYVSTRHKPLSRWKTQLPWSGLQWTCTNHMKHHGQSWAQEGQSAWRFEQVVERMQPSVSWRRLRTGWLLHRMPWGPVHHSQQNSLCPVSCMWHPFKGTSLLKTYSIKQIQKIKIQPRMLFWNVQLILLTHMKNFKISNDHSVGLAIWLTVQTWQ